MSMDGFLYCATDQNGNLKIGFTQKPARLPLRFGKQRPILGIIPASREIEHWFHRQFVTDKVPGMIEWYRSGTPAASVISSLPFRSTKEDWLEGDPVFDFSMLGFIPKSEKPPTRNAMDLPPDALDFFRQNGRRGGLKRDPNTIPADQRRGFAQKASRTRWEALRGPGQGSAGKD